MPEAIFGICALLMLVWVVVELLFRFVKTDTLEYDFQYLWEHYRLKPEDIQPPKQTGKKRR